MPDDSPKPMRDWWARGGALFSVVLTLVGLFYAHASSPYYYAAPSDLIYRISGAVDRAGVNGAKSLLITHNCEIENLSSKPAVGIQIRIGCLGADWRVTDASAAFEVRQLSKDEAIVTLERVVPGETASISLEFDLTKRFQRMMSTHKPAKGRPDYVPGIAAISYLVETGVKSVSVERGFVPKSPDGSFETEGIEELLSNAINWLEPA